MGFLIRRELTFRVWCNTAIVFLTALAISACSSQTEEVASTPKVRPAKLTTLESASVARTLSFPAVIEAEQSSEMTFQVSGFVTQLNVLEGDEVKKGQIIARVEERDFQNSVAQAQAQFDNAEVEYQRAKRLAEQDAISQSVLDTRRTNRDVAKASLDSAKKTSGDTVLRAPFSGFISNVLVERFQNIQAKEPIAIIQSDSMVAVVNAPADIVARTPQFEPKDASVLLDVAPTTYIPGTFKEASGQADPATQTFQARFSFESPENVLVLPGMTAAVSMKYNFNDSADIVPVGIAVPVSAVLAEGDDLYVWRVDQSTMQISKAPITRGMGMVGQHVIATSGVSAGDVIVATGGSFMHDGMTVRAWQPK